MPAYATSGCLAIVSLARGSIAYVPGVNSVYVIASEPHRDELVYTQRTSYVDHVAYPFIHARADGKQIREISNEEASDAPLLKQYLRKIHATISVDGRTLPK